MAQVKSVSRDPSPVRECVKSHFEICLTELRSTVHWVTLLVLDISLFNQKERMINLNLDNKITNCNIP